MIIDTHTHLNLSPLFEHWKASLDQSEQAGVSPVIVPGADLETSRRAVEIAEADSRVYAAVGIHPESVGEDVSALRKLITSDQIVAIGECGLDYFRGNENRGKQKKLFEAQVELAQEAHLPLIIHTRTTEAMTDAVTILKGFKGRVVFHCFSGTIDFWEQIEPMGGMIGVGATITYPKNEALRTVIEQIPIDRIMMETDAPWLPPQPKRGQINIPSNVTISALKLAEIKHIQLSRVMEVTTKNAAQFFTINLG